MSSDQFGLAVKLVRRDAESCVLTLAGELSLRSAGTACGAITKALLEVDRVLVDVSRLRLTWTPAAQVFPSTLAAMGGWPWARLVLFGAGRVVERTLGHRDRAARRGRTRSPTTPRAAPTDRIPIPRPGEGGVVADPGASVRRGRVHGLAPRLRDDAVIVSSELVANAVQHARTECRLTVQLDARGLTIAVQDHRPGGIRRRPTIDATNLRGLGLFVVDRLSRPGEPGRPSTARRSGRSCC